MEKRNKILIILASIFIVGLLIGVAAFWLLPRFLGADAEAIARTMPNDTAVFLELNLLNLQNADTRELTSAWEDSYAEADIPLNGSDPSTLLNILDIPLQQIADITVSEDVRPWVGLNIGLGLLFSDPASPPAWVVAATVRDNGKAEAFVTQLTANIASQNDVLIGSQPYQPEVRLVDDILIIASDEDVLEQTLAASETLSLSDSKQFQETLAALPENRAITLYGDADIINDFLTTAVPPENAGVLQAVRGILPEYTAVGLGGTAVPQGVQLDMVGFHKPLIESQNEWLEAQQTDPKLDAVLPEDTALFLSGRRLDLIWQLLKGSLAGLGYAEADVDESMALFSNIFGFNPDTELLAALSDEYAIALVPAEDDLYPVALAIHPNATELSSQMEQLAAGLTLLGIAASEDEKTFNLADLNGQPLLSYTQLDEVLLVSTDVLGLTAVSQKPASLAENTDYTNSWGIFPEGAIPVLYIDLGQIIAATGPETAVELQPITQAALASQSDAETSRASLIIFLGGSSENN